MVIGSLSLCGFFEIFVESVSEVLSIIPEKSIQKLILNKRPMRLILTFYIFDGCRLKFE